MAGWPISDGTVGIVPHLRLVSLDRFEVTPGEREHPDVPAPAPEQLRAGGPKRALGVLTLMELLIAISDPGHWRGSSSSLSTALPRSGRGDRSSECSTADGSPRPVIHREGANEAFDGVTVSRSPQYHASLRAPTGFDKKEGAP